MSTSTRTRIDALTPDDLAAAGQVLNAAFGRTGMLRGLNLAYGLQPAGWFCARRQDGRIAGVVGAHDYGPFASIGMMAVAPEAQGQGIGQGLMRQLLAYLDARGCPMAFLDASAAGQRLYPRLGFRPDGETWRMAWQRRELAAVEDAWGAPSRGRAGVGVAMAAQARPGPIEIYPLTDADLPAVAAFDGVRFGAARPDVLGAFAEQTAGRAFLALDGARQVAGYIMADQAHLGPWLAASPEVAGGLLQAALALPYVPAPLLTLPAANAAGVALLAQHGFVKTETLLHMRRGGEGDPRACNAIYGQASLTLG